MYTYYQQVFLHLWTIFKQFGVFQFVAIYVSSFYQHFVSAFTVQWSSITNPNVYQYSAFIYIDSVQWGRLRDNLIEIGDTHDKKHQIYTRRSFYTCQCKILPGSNPESVTFTFYIFETGRAIFRDRAAALLLG